MRFSLPVMLAGILAMPIMSIASLPVVAAALPGRTVAAPTTQASGCSSLVLTVHPGLNPSPPNAMHLSVPHDAPSPLTVYLPLYPGAVPATSLVQPVFPLYPADPYLQTAGAEYTTPNAPGSVVAWENRDFPACHWGRHGYWSGNGSAFTSGIDWQSTDDPRISLYVSVGRAPSGGTLIAYGVEAILTPARPARSYVRGPFIRVGIVLKLDTLVRGKAVPHIGHVTLLDRAAIRELIEATNAMKDYRTAFGVCSGGLSLTGPAWLTFVRPNGTRAHAFERGPGGCGGGLAVNGVRWLVDDGRLWNLITKLVALQSGGTSTGTGESRMNRPASQKPWTIQRVLDVGSATALCAAHPLARFTASIRGYLTATPLQGPGGGWVGRLFTAPNPHAFFAGDTKPFVQVWGTKAWSLDLSDRQVTFHGILICDASKYAGNLPGWHGSFTPDRYSII